MSKRLSAVPNSDDTTGSEKSNKSFTRLVQKSLINSRTSTSFNTTFSEENNDNLLNWIDSLKIRASETFGKQKAELIQLRKNSQKEELKRKYREQVDSATFDKLGKLLKKTQRQKNEKNAEIERQLSSGGQMRVLFDDSDNFDNSNNSKYSDAEIASGALNYQDSRYHKYHDEEQDDGVDQEEESSYGYDDEALAVNPQLAGVHRFVQGNISGEMESYNRPYGDNDLVEILSDESSDDLPLSHPNYTERYEEDSGENGILSNEEIEEESGEDIDEIDNINETDEIDEYDKFDVDKEKSGETQEYPNHAISHQPSAYIKPFSASHVHTSNALLYSHNCQPRISDYSLQESSYTSDLQHQMKEHSDDSEDLEELSETLGAVEDQYEDDDLEDDLGRALEENNYSETEDLLLGHDRDAGEISVPYSQYGNTHSGSTHVSGALQEGVVENMRHDQNEHHEEHHEASEEYEEEARYSQSETPIVNPSANLFESEDYELHHNNSPGNAGLVEETKDIVISSEEESPDPSEREINFHNFDEAVESAREHASLGEGFYDDGVHNREELIQNAHVHDEDVSSNMSENLDSGRYAGQNYPNIPEETEITSNSPKQDGENESPVFLAQYALSAYLNDERNHGKEFSGDRNIVLNESTISIDAQSEQFSKSANAFEDALLSQKDIINIDDSSIDDRSEIGYAAEHLESEKEDSQTVDVHDISTVSTQDEPPVPVSNRFPVFKTISEDDPKTVLKQLKKTQKKFNIQLDAVDQLTSELGDVSSTADSDQSQFRTSHSLLYDALSSDVHFRDSGIDPQIDNAVQMDAETANGETTAKKAAEVLLPKPKVSQLADVTSDEFESFDADDSRSLIAEIDDLNAEKEPQTIPEVIERTTQEEVLVMLDEFTKYETEVVLASTEIEEPVTEVFSQAMNSALNESALENFTDAEEDVSVSPTENFEPMENVHSPAHVVLETYEEALEVVVPTSIVEAQSLRNTPVISYDKADNACEQDSYSDILIDGSLPRDMGAAKAHDTVQAEQLAEEETVTSNEIFDCAELVQEPEVEMDADVNTSNAIQDNLSRQEVNYSDISNPENVDLNIVSDDSTATGVAGVIHVDSKSSSDNVDLEDLETYPELENAAANFENPSTDHSNTEGYKNTEEVPEVDTANGVENFQSNPTFEPADDIRIKNDEDIRNLEDTVGHTVGHTDATDEASLSLAQEESIDLIDGSKNAFTNSLKRNIESLERSSSPAKRFRDAFSKLNPFNWRQRNSSPDAEKEIEGVVTETVVQELESPSVESSGISENKRSDDVLLNPEDTHGDEHKVESESSHVSDETSEVSEVIVHDTMQTLMHGGADTNLNISFSNVQDKEEDSNMNRDVIVFSDSPDLGMANENKNKLTPISLHNPENNDIDTNQHTTSVSEDMELDTREPQSYPDDPEVGSKTIDVSVPIKTTIVEVESEVQSEFEPLTDLPSDSEMIQEMRPASESIMLVVPPLPTPASFMRIAEVIRLSQEEERSYEVNQEHESRGIGSEAPFKFESSPNQVASVSEARSYIDEDFEPAEEQSGVGMTGAKNEDKLFETEMRDKDSSDKNLEQDREISGKIEKKENSMEQEIISLPTESNLNDSPGQGTDDGDRGPVDVAHVADVDDVGDIAGVADVIDIAVNGADSGAPAVSSIAPALDADSDVADKVVDNYTENQVKKIDSDREEVTDVIGQNATGFSVRELCGNISKDDKIASANESEFTDAVIENPAGISTPEKPTEDIVENIAEKLIPERTLNETTDNIVEKSNADVISDAIIQELVEQPSADGTTNVNLKELTDKTNAVEATDASVETIVEKSNLEVNADAIVEELVDESNADAITDVQTEFVEEPIADQNIKAILEESVEKLNAKRTTDATVEDSGKKTSPKHTTKTIDEELVEKSNTDAILEGYAENTNVQASTEGIFEDLDVRRIAEQTTDTIVEEFSNLEETGTHAKPNKARPSFNIIPPSTENITQVVETQEENFIANITERQEVVDGFKWWKEHKKPAFNVESDLHNEKGPMHQEVEKKETLEDESDREASSNPSLAEKFGDTIHDLTDDGSNVSKTVELEESVVTAVLENSEAILVAKINESEGVSDKQGKNHIGDKTPTEKFEPPQSAESVKANVQQEPASIISESAAKNPVPPIQTGKSVMEVFFAPDIDIEAENIVSNTFKKPPQSPKTKSTRKKALFSPVCSDRILRKRSIAGGLSKPKPDEPLKDIHGLTVEAADSEESKVKDDSDPMMENTSMIENVAASTSATAEPDAEPVAEPVTEPVAEPVVEPVVEPVIEPVVTAEPKDLTISLVKNEANESKFSPNLHKSGVSDITDKTHIDTDLGAHSEITSKATFNYKDDPTETTKRPYEGKSFVEVKSPTISSAKRRSEDDAKTEMGGFEKKQKLADLGFENETKQTYSYTVKSVVESNTKETSSTTNLPLEGPLDRDSQTTDFKAEETKLADATAAGQVSGKFQGFSYLREKSKKEISGKRKKRGKAKKAKEIRNSDVLSEELAKEVERAKQVEKTKEFEKAKQAEIEKEVTRAKDAERAKEAEIAKEFQKARQARKVERVKEAERAKRVNAKEEKAKAKKAKRRVAKEDRAKEDKAKKDKAKKGKAKKDKAKEFKKFTKIQNSIDAAKVKVVEKQLGKERETKGKATNKLTEPEFKSKNQDTKTAVAEPLSTPKKAEQKPAPLKQTRVKKSFAIPSSVIEKSDSMVGLGTHLTVDKANPEDHPSLRTRSKSPIKRSIQELSSEITEQPARKKRAMKKRKPVLDVNDPEIEHEQNNRGRPRKRS